MADVYIALMVCSCPPFGFLEEEKAVTNLFTNLSSDQTPPKESIKSFIWLEILPNLVGLEIIIASAQTRSSGLAIFISSVALIVLSHIDPSITLLVSLNSLTFNSLTSAPFFLLLPLHMKPFYNLLLFENKKLLIILTFSQLTPFVINLYIYLYKKHTHLLFLLLNILYIKKVGQKVLLVYPTTIFKILPGI
jgi:hypothetical protein